MRITVIGGGHIGTLMAAQFAYKKHDITIFTSKPELWNKTLTVYNTDKTVIMQGTIHHVTGCLNEAVTDAEIIFITLPSFMFEKIAAELFDLVHSKQIIGIIPGSGGAEFAFRKLIQKGCILFGLQRVHSIARLQKYGHSVYMLGEKDKLHVAAIPGEQTPEIAYMLEKLFNIPMDILPNYLCVTLTPSNPILHTARLYSLFSDYTDDVTYPENFLFYENWDHKSTSVLFACDHELQELCKKIDKLDLRTVLSLPEYYEASSIEHFTRKINQIPAFKGIPSPMKHVQNGWIPDFTSRYFTADFPFGLKIIHDIGNLFHVPMPTIDCIWEWYCRMPIQPASGSNFSLPFTQTNEFYNIYTS